MNRAEELVHKWVDESLSFSEAEELAALLERGGNEAEAALDEVEGVDVEELREMARFVILRRS